MSTNTEPPKSPFPWPLLLVGGVAVAGIIFSRTSVGPGAKPNAVTPSASASAAVAVALPTTPSKDHPGFKKPLPKGGLMLGQKVTHTVQPGEYLETLANRYLEFTDYYTWPELSKAIKTANNFTRDYVNPGEKVVIPNILAEPPFAETVARPKNFAANGCYITNTSAASPRMFSIIKQLKPLGLNAVVFDAKDMSGIIGYDSKVPLVRAMNADREGGIHDLSKMIAKLHKEGIHVIARQTQFYDMELVKKHPELSVKFQGGGLFNEGDGIATWADPSLKAVQDYNIAIATELASHGVDEIQFDYIRFPAMGQTHLAKYANFDPKTTQKYEVIGAYLARARAALKPYKALLSVDVYGTVAWDQPIDVRITGQRLDVMAQHVDAISSMLYPSHFYGTFDNFDYPPDHPYYFYEQGVAKVGNKTAAYGAVNRPWIQAFPYRIRNYGPEYIRQQLQGTWDSGGSGWLLWNANNDYDVAARALTGWKPKESNKRSQALAHFARLAAGQSDSVANPSEVQAAAGSDSRPH
ncbi:MAG: LysM peptidoglycan-binding domain-containing protein [Candidatus Sericytochromatia bacterium]|nr:LysM peptidoglycan-binding domain-containing protein [Candidatus Sericytochromatia bacterium]